MSINDYILILVVILELFLGISLTTDEDREEKIGAKKNNKFNDWIIIYNSTSNGVN